MGRALPIALLLLTGAGPLTGQAPSPFRATGTAPAGPLRPASFPAVSPPAVARAPAAGAPAWTAQAAAHDGLRAALRTPAGAFAASAVAPGAGQAALGLRRWIAYAAVEAGFWWVWADARSDFRAYRDGYLDVAWEAARIQDGPRREAGWSYYETMSHWLSSGAYDSDAAAGVQPEADPATYNGSVWEIARGLYLGGAAPDPGTPEYALALAWYEERAAGPGFLWSWAGEEAALERFRGLIASADDARRTETTALGVILANHLISAIDALLAARISAADRPALDAAAVPGPAGPGLRLRVRFPLTTSNGQDR